MSLSLHDSFVVGTECLALSKAVRGLQKELERRKNKWKSREQALNQQIEEKQRTCQKLQTQVQGMSTIWVGMFVSV